MTEKDPYGFDVMDYRERLYIPHIFSLLGKLGFYAKNAYRMRYFGEGARALNFLRVFAPPLWQPITNTCDGTNLLRYH